MQTYSVLVTARGEAEHSCECELCDRPALVEVMATFEDIITAAGDYDAGIVARKAINAALDTATPRGYWLIESTLQITEDIHPLDYVAQARLSGYPTLPGLGV